MTQEQICKFEMFERVIKYCNENAATVALIPAFQSDKIALENILPKIRQLAALVEADNAHTENKQSIKTDMVALGVDVCTNLMGYGLMTKDMALTKMSTHTKSSLGRGKEEEILQRCQSIAAKARMLLAQLMAKRGMHEELLTQFEDYVAQFQTIKPEPRSAMQEKTMLLTELLALFDEADLAMTLLSGSAVNFRNVADDFLARFEKATSIFAPKTARTKIKVIAENMLTKTKISGFHLESSALNLTKQIAEAKPTAFFAMYHEGSDFVITKEGFEPVILENIKIIKGKVNVIRVQMTPLKAA